MARLNEPPVSTDTIETLRRKFLRQNRDIARVNSAQSLRIRSLEGECGRLLSENLALNGRILELERELDETRPSQRIADQALEIKAKMEAQLIEWGAMLQGMGVEPAAKRKATTSPGGRRIVKPRKSGDRSPAATRRPRDSRSAEELAAMQEGRLPPIHENKMYPRRTMGHAELLAVFTEAADTSDSPDLGPPPTSRFVEEDPVKIDSPTRSTGTLEPSPKIIKGEALPRPDVPAQPKLDPKKRPVPATENVATDDIERADLTDASSRPLLKAGSKRKFGDENDENRNPRSFLDKEQEAHDKSACEKPLAVGDLKSRRNSKGASKTAQVTEATAMRPRKPLADKGTNDDLVSPKKLIKSATTGDLKKIMTEADRAVAPMKKKRVVPIKLSIPSLPAPSMVKAPQEPATPSADPGIVSPGTPETTSTFDNPGDTPPPVDISARGETSRPSRRVRAAISYAEPSLRDKMRRPTKELLDAVSGEGKSLRSGSAHLVGPLSSTKTKADDEGTAAGSSKPPHGAEAAMASEAARRPAVVSPLMQREPSKEQSQVELPESVVTERRRRPSSRQSQLLEPQGEEEDATDEAKHDKADPYEFQSTPPALQQPKEAASHKGRITKGMRRSMAVAASGHSGDAAAESSRPSRKRVSMAAPKKASMLDPPADYDSSFEASGGEVTKADPSSSVGDRISRRRSMML